jgi:hypothetical protein
MHKLCWEAAFPIIGQVDLVFSLKKTHVFNDHMHSCCILLLYVGLILYTFLCVYFINATMHTLSLYKYNIFLFHLTVLVRCKTTKQNKTNRSYNSKTLSAY